MIFSPRIKQLELASLCRRLSVALESGIDVRRVFAREAGGRTSGALRQQLETISKAISDGDSLHAALEQTGSFFPQLFREMVLVGEQSGQGAEVFRQLADHYEHQVKLRRMFVSSIIWPMIQLTMALGIVGLLIFIMGMLPNDPRTKKPMDLLGFGLIGTDGLRKYTLILVLIGVAIWFVIQATRRGMLWTQPLQRAVMRVPKLGRALEVMALARLAWSMNLTFGTGMDILKALPLSLRSTQNAHYTQHEEEVLSLLRRGQEVHEALAVTNAFPGDFLDAIEVGERSGRLPETMAHLSEQYKDEAQRAMAVFTQIAGFLVWGMVATLIITLIFRLFGWYAGQLNNAINGM